MTNKERISNYVNQLISKFIIPSQLVTNNFKKRVESLLIDIPENITPFQFFDAFISKILLINKELGRDAGLILYPNYPNEKLESNFFFEPKDDFDYIFKFLDYFLNRDYTPKIYQTYTHIIPIDYGHMTNKSLSTNQYKLIHSFSDVHNLLALTMEDCFTIITNNKKQSSVLLNFIPNQQPSIYHYVPSPNYTTSKFNFQESVFDQPKLDLFKRNIELGTFSPTNLLFEGKNYTFGLEIETCYGLVESKKYKDLNVSCIYDGSLKDEDGIARGGEYVTGVLTGDAGVNQLKKLVNTLVDSGCKVNNKCSVHVHIGSCNFNKKTLLAMYILGKTLENEIFSLFPKSRSNNVYCRRLEQILTKEELRSLEDTEKLSESEFESLINYLFDLKLFPYVKQGSLQYHNLEQLDKKSISSIVNSLRPNKSHNKLLQHPNGAKCGYDKHMQRYCWLNFVTCLYNNKGKEAKTLEFRIHNGTLNFKKILAWLKICVAITWFSENHQKAIFNGYYADPVTKATLPITLDLVIKLAYPKTSKVLLSYIEERKSLFNVDNDSLAEFTEYTESLNLVNSFKLKELFDFNS